MTTSLPFVPGFAERFTTKVACARRPYGEPRWYLQAMSAVCVSGEPDFRATTVPMVVSDCAIWKPAAVNSLVAARTISAADFATFSCSGAGACGALMQPATDMSATTPDNFMMCVTAGTRRSLLEMIAAFRRDGVFKYNAPPHQARYMSLMARDTGTPLHPRIAEHD